MSRAELFRGVAEVEKLPVVLYKEHGYEMFDLKRE